jgi:hypothetical protein
MLYRVACGFTGEWRSCLTASSDVKELIPEFYQPAVSLFLRNDLQLELGVRQDGSAVRYTPRTDSPFH